MKPYLIIFVSLIFISVQSQEKDKVKRFSEEIMDIIGNRYIDRFCEIKISGNNKIDDHILGYIFGDNTYKGFSTFFKNKDIITKTYGPITKGRDSYYHIIYYLPEILNDENEITSELNLKDIWGKKYLETLITIEKNNIKFYLTPFYFETEYPW